MNTHPTLLRIMASWLSGGALLLALSGAAWAQLADTAWPMFQHDVRHSGQSDQLGPMFGPAGPTPQDVKVWHGVDKLRTSMALSADGTTLYLGLGFKFCAIWTATMTTRQCFQLRADVSDASPAIGLDGTIYFGDRDNSLNAFNPDATLKWRFNNGGEGDVWTSPAIGSQLPGRPETAHMDGTIYYGHTQSNFGDGAFMALTDTNNAANCSPAPAPCAKVKWHYTIGTFLKQSSPAIDQDGYIYIADVNGTLHMFQDNGPNDVKRWWTKKVGSSVSASPVISKDGKTLYIGMNTGLVALDISKRDINGDPTEPGDPLWTFLTNGKVDQTPALATDATTGEQTLYVPSMSGALKTLWAVSSDGEFKWKYGPVNTGSETSVYPIVGADGIVYVGANLGVYALHPLSGSVLWSYQTQNVIQAYPIIGGTADPDTGGPATLYLPSRDWNLYAISSTRTRTDTNHPPTADARACVSLCSTDADYSHSDQSVPAGKVVMFDGSHSSDVDLPPDLLFYSWDFGDGTFGSGVKTTHIYRTEGDYSATLTVSDLLSSSDHNPCHPSDAPQPPRCVKITVIPSQYPSFTDDFNRADSPVLGGPNAPAAPLWAEVKGDLKIEGGKMKAATGGISIAILPDLFGGNQSAKAEFTPANNYSGPRLGVILRYVDVNNYYTIYRSAGGTSALRISKFVNGNEIVLANMPMPQPPVGIPFKLLGRVDGSILRLYLAEPAGGDLVQKLTVSDSTFVDGNVGIVIGGGPSPHAADNFCATVNTGTCP